MGKGNPIIQFRIDRETLKVIEHLVRKSVDNPNAPHTVSSWIRAAIFDKLKHHVRNKRSKFFTDKTVEERLQIFKNSLDMD